MNNIYFIVAPSGSGKTSICNMLKEKYNITDNIDILGCNIEEINDRIEKLNSKLD